MIFAKSLEIQARLEARWLENEKRYYALVEGKPQKSEGTIRSWLTENAALKTYSTTRTENAKPATTHYKVMMQWDKVSLIEVQLETGRKHQIRVHLSEMGCPIVATKNTAQTSTRLVE